MGVGTEIHNPQEVIDYLDQKLFDLNDDYRSARKYSLKNPRIKVIKPEVFYNYMESIGKIGSQNKMPRVLNTEQSKMWLDYISAI